MEELLCHWIHSQNFFEKSIQTDEFGQIFIHAIIMEDFFQKFLLNTGFLCECVKTVGENSRRRIKTRDRYNEDTTE